MQVKGSLLLVVSLLLHLLTQGQDTSFTNLKSVIISANKLKEKRIQAPIAISILSSKVVDETKAQRIDALLNKVSGVYMPTIGNEQHMMAIRQPISLKGLYLYLEEGMPIRTSGLFSANALIEINSDNIYSIEILKGPASALYGAEAIGGVINIIPNPIPIKTNFSITNQMNDVGFKKIAINAGMPNKTGGWQINSSWLDQKNGVTEYSDYHKKSISIRHDFEINKKLKAYQTLNYIDYYTQMTGSLDSIKFFQKNFGTQQTFTFRQINAFRFRQNLQYSWNDQSTTTLNAMYRNNIMDQNPTYSIASTINPTKFKGQVNSNQFDSYVVDIQHYWNLKALKSKLLLGGYWDLTRQNLIAHYIDIFKDTTIGKYTKYTYPSIDSLITSYHTQLSNKAIYANYIFDINKSIRFNASIRYDDFEYLFYNELTSGTPSANNHFTNWTPKIGFTYNKGNWGSYFNYSEGFVPPQITEIYNAIRVPYLLPQLFKNFEVGSWYQNKKIYSEISLYQLNGNNEIISVRQTDGVNLNQNSGATQHLGIEYQFRYQISPSLEFLLNGTNTKHTYISTNIKGTDVSGNEMNAAPHFFNNITVSWKPTLALRIALEAQHQSKYFMDETNKTTYPGFDVMNMRVGYNFKKSELWLNILNITNAYYSTMATRNFSVKGSSAYSYYLGDPRSITLGWKWYIIK
ncbi:MAG: TonB-dependent receptor [Bacteroidetes bacterium]|nr:TonB-dependent receptor [Bacteroidota bacterium]